MPSLGDVSPRIRIGRTAVRRHNLTIFPLFAEDAIHPAIYVPVGAAIKSGTARVTEVSEGGSVPTLALENTGAIPVLIIDGEELIGARQNRISNVSILAPANQTLPIPVSCVERGRWSYRTREFSESPDIMFSKARARKSRDVSHQLAMSGGRASDQGAVWNDISELSAKLGCASPTDAMGDVFETRRASVEEYVDGVEVAEGQIGAIFAINGVAAGLELFDSTETLRTYLPKILRSYALDAISNQTLAPIEPDNDEASKLLNSILELDVRTFPGVGLGEDLRINSPDITGGALSFEGRVVHLAAFSTVAPDSARNPRQANGTVYPLEIRHGHLLLKTEAGTALLDTGSPFSIGRGEPVTIAGRTWNPSNGMESILDTANAHIHRRIDWLLGHDFFAGNRVVIDWPNRQARVLENYERVDRGRTIRIEFVMGVPVTRARLQDKVVRAVIDSGASLSYVPEEVVQHLEPTGTRRDFYPGFGEFETKTWRVRAAIGGRRFSMMAGVLPPTLKMLLSLILGDDGWIVGSDFFRGRVIEIDYANGRLTDIT